MQAKDQPKKRKEDVLPGADAFDSLLDKVVEQDGVVFSTPQGVKKKLRAEKRVQKKPSFVFDRPVTGNTEDVAEKLDMESVACVVKRHEAAVSESVKIKHEPHTRSPFVVSLRECFMPTEGASEERIPVAEQIVYGQTLVQPPGSFRNLTDSALKSKIDPLAKTHQFTSSQPAAGPLYFRLWSKKVQLGLRRLFSKSSRTMVSLKQKEHAMLASAEQEFASAAEEVAAAPFSYAKAGLGFLVLVVIITLPAQAIVLYRNVTDERNQVESEGQKAVASLADLSQATSLDVSLQQLQDASGRFKEADRLLDESRLLAVTAAAVVPKQYDSARSLLEVGNKMSQAGQLLTMGFGKVFDDPQRGLIERLEVMGAYARGTLPLLADAEQAAQKIDLSIIPQEQRDKAKSLPDKISQAQESIREFAVLSDAMVGFLGKDTRRTYLLVFQNQTELRPSGGFMGSVAELTVDQGKIVSIYVPKGGTYDLKGQLTVREQSPKPLQLINPLWQFQDSNWFADFPKTANKVNWFWSKSGQPTLDGLITVNASFMEKVLQVTGPIEMPDYHKTITADNFLLETQKAVEIEYDKQANTPKKFIGDLFGQVMERAKTLTPQQWLSLAGTCSQALETKEIQIAMFHPDEEQLVERFDWQGRLKPTAGDSLAIIGANVAGQKTDGVVQESVKHVAEIQPDGSIIDTVHLDRTHQGKKGDLFSGVRNVEYLRVYVPKGSELLDAQGFDPPAANLFKQPLDTDGLDPDLAAIDKTAKQAMNTVWTADEDDRTVFGGWMQLDPGQSQELVLRYRLPFTVYDIMDKVQEAPDQNSMDRTRGAYLMLLTSQSGKTRQMTHEVQLASPWKSVWTRGQVATASDDKLGWQGTWDRDQAVAILLSNSDNSHGQNQ